MDAGVGRNLEVRLGVRRSACRQTGNPAVPTYMVTVFGQKTGGSAGFVPAKGAALDGRGSEPSALVHRQQCITGFDCQASWPHCRGYSKKASESRIHGGEARRVQGKGRRRHVRSPAGKGSILGR